jgi:hypothetical protein
MQQRLSACRCTCPFKTGTWRPSSGEQGLRSLASMAQVGWDPQTGVVPQHRRALLGGSAAACVASVTSVHACI